MSLFSRCDPSQLAGSDRHAAPPRRARLGTGSASGFRGFAEDIGILFRYAMGLDYYGRGPRRSRDR